MNTSSANLPLVDSVVPFDLAAHDEFVTEISAVLKKHDICDQIGLCLLHRHYDIRPDEMLVETTDSQNRVSTLKPVLAASLAKEDLLETMWKVDKRGKVTVLQYCDRCGR